MFYIRSANAVSVGEDAVCINTGTGGGIIEAVSCNAAAMPPDGHQKLFVIEEMSSRCRPLLPMAAGFIFRSGNNLSHFANIIRHSHIPACISEELWTAASHRDGEYGELGSQERAVYPQGAAAAYAERYGAYCAQLEKDMCLPVYDVRHQKLRLPGEKAGFRIGQKALSVGSLVAQGCRTPDTLLLGNFAPACDAADEPCIDAIVRHFEPAGAALPTLMVRPSLWTDPFSRRFVSGIMSSKTVCGRDGLSRRLNALLGERRGLPLTEAECSLSIAIQEHIPVRLFGLLFTRLPWNGLSSALILQLSRGDGAPGCVQITAGLPDIPVSPAYIKNHIRPKAGFVLTDGILTDGFCRNLAGFMTRCFELCSRLLIPLEVEFIVDQSGDFVFIQFREIFRELINNTQEG